MATSSLTEADEATTLRVHLPCYLEVSESSVEDGMRQRRAMRLAAVSWKAHGFLSAC